MSKKVFIASVVGLLVGGVVSMFLTAHFMLPITKNYLGSDALYIKLDDQEKPHPYWKILEQDYLGELYLHHPLLFYKRKEGYQLLEDLAKRGYTPAASSLYFYHHHKLRDYSDSYFFNEEKARKMHENMHKWAILAAEQGEAIILHMELKYHNLEQFKDVSYEIKLLEDHARQSQVPTVAEFLTDYHKKHNNPQKAAHWAQVAADIKASPFTAPTCATITPWRGY